MADDLLPYLAEAAGLLLDWEDVAGTPRRVSNEAARAILTALGHPCASQAQIAHSLEELAQAPEPSMRVVAAGTALRLPASSTAARLHLEDGGVCNLPATASGVYDLAGVAPGYHRLEHADAECLVAVCPPRCPTPHDRLGRRGWGLTAQIYSLREAGAFGDFGDLAVLAAEAARAGADALALSPTHALFAADPGRYSPYSPSSRDQLNVLFADPAAILGRTRNRVDKDLIDWCEAAPIKLAELRAALQLQAQDPRKGAFIEAGGEDLFHHALFEALHAHFHAKGRSDWRDWPKPFHAPKSAAAAAAALGISDDIDLHLGLQWLADLGLQQAQAAARSGGMKLGLISDLAVGVDPAGAHAWARPDELLTGLTLGAPPDAFAPSGQGWGITTFAPCALERMAFAPFLRTLRAALRRAGGVRIDHALGLKRLWVIPDGASSLEGAYLRAPFEDFLNLIALEAQRADAVVIGEDLGVVPPGLRAELETHGLLGMRVLPFERTEEGFRPPQTWDRRAVAMTSTHDMAPIARWWRGADLEWQAQQAAEFDRPKEAAARAEQRTEFWRAAASAGVAGKTQPRPEEPQIAVDAAIAMVSATPCELALVPLEDLIGLERQVNVPGTVDAHPNWRGRLPLGAREMFSHPAVAARVARLNRRGAA